MAERRMFTQKITESDAFLEMPCSTQNFYFHLCMHADDDGFVNSPKKIQRSIGATDDDARILITKNFIIPFESGVMVIKHWRMHNQLRKDRYHPTDYYEEKCRLYLKSDGAYTLDETQGQKLVATTWQPNGNQMAPEYRIGKDSEEERKKENKENKDIISSSMGADAHTREESIFTKMSDEELIAWGENQVPDFSNPESVALFEEYRAETRRRANKTWQGKIVGIDGSIKRLQSHDEIIQEWGCSPCVKMKLKEFLRGCYLNGCVITNEQLNSILFELDHYDTDEDKNSVLQSAISGGYKDIKRLFT